MIFERGNKIIERAHKAAVYAGIIHEAIVLGVRWEITHGKDNIKVSTEDVLRHPIYRGVGLFLTMIEDSSKSLLTSYKVGRAYGSLYYNCKTSMLFGSRENPKPDIKDYN